MWLAKNKNGALRIFERKPKRFHDGPMLGSKYIGFNDAVTVGDGKDDYSFWAVQEFLDSNRIDDQRSFGIAILTERKEEDKTVRISYVPECAKNLTWEDEPVEVGIYILR